MADAGDETDIAFEDQTAVLYEDGRLADAVSAREGASVWRVEPGENGTAVTADAGERRIDSRSIEDARPAIDAVPPEIVELRQTLRARDAVGRSRIGRLD